MARHSCFALACCIALGSLVTGSAALGAPRGRLPSAHGDEARAPASAGRVRPARASDLDYTQVIDANDIRMSVTNNGWFAYDAQQSMPGLEFPNGSGKTLVFAGGLWLGAQVNGQTRVTVAEYSSEYGPGSMVSGQPDNWSLPQYHVYKLLRNYPSTAARDQALTDYNAGALPYGAPPVSPVGATSLGITGDQMLWSVFNDADPGFHTSDAGSTPPLGVEVRHTTWAFADAGPLGRTVFLRYQILNRGTNDLQGLRIGLWSDPDVGGFTDDLAGSIPGSGLGYAYNVSNVDAVYGAPVPAIGFDMVAGPVPPGSGSPLPLSAFVRYVNGEDPINALWSFNSLCGLQGNGGTILDPTSGLPTTFMLSGDPIAGTGWINQSPTDERLLLSTGPLHLAPGQSVEVTWAVVVAQEAGALPSLARLRCDDPIVQNAYDAGFPLPLPAHGPCTLPVNCTRPSDYWHEQCGPSAEFSQEQMNEIAWRVGSYSHYFAWSAPVAQLCGVFSGSSPRNLAEQEYAALLCNLAAGASPAVVPSSGLRLFLDGATPVACAGLSAATIGELAAIAPLMVTGNYLDRVADHATALAGVPLGLSAFDGGAGPAWDLFGSTISTAQIDSFPRVELHFDRTHPQKAYRYLRFETATGAIPASYPWGRGYVYAGFHDVPFTAWDVEHGRQLEVGFVERAVVDDDGTLQPPAAQVATFDSTWAPDDSPTGGREYLFVFSRPYAGVARPELTADFAILDGTLPALYALAARLVDPASQIDDGDAFELDLDVAPGPSVDALMFQLAGLPPAEADPVYLQIASCLFDINHGVGIGPTCDTPTAALISLVRAESAPDRVTLTWLASEPVTATVERSAGGPWTEVARRTTDGNGMIGFEDRDLVPGTRYGYRLRLTAEGGEQVLGETWVDVPLAASLGLTGFVPNPARGAAGIAFSLADRAPTALTLYDIAGRRVRTIQVGSLGPGTHVVPIGAGLPSGVYVIRLQQAGRTLTARSALVR